MGEEATASSRELADWLAKDGQLLISPKAQGRRGTDREVYWHGVQGGRIALKERQLRVAKPRLRKKRRRAGESGEVEVPAYTALQADQGLADRMLELVMNGVSTRRYASVLPEMADQVGISKSEVSRETIEAGTRVLKELAERDLSALDVLVVYVDGIVFGDYHVLAAVGVDGEALPVAGRRRGCARPASGAARRGGPIAPGRGGSGCSAGSVLSRHPSSSNVTCRLLADTPSRKRSNASDRRALSLLDRRVGIDGESGPRPERVADLLPLRGGQEEGLEPAEVLRALDGEVAGLDLVADLEEQGALPATAIGHARRGG